MSITWISVYLLVQTNVIQPVIYPGHYDRTSCNALKEAMRDPNGELKCIPVKIPAIIIPDQK